jgi:regulatory protein
MPSSLTPDKIFERAMRYLERYAASAEGVRTVLRRGLMRDARRGEIIPEEAPEWIEKAVSRLVEMKALDDRKFAETKTRSLRRAGASSHKIRQTLAAKGVDAETVSTALAGEEGGDDETAALAFARKRRLGPFAPPARRAEQRDKHLAALARAGFSLALARRIINAKEAKELED